jgi:hypothetical protein
MAWISSRVGVPTTLIISTSWSTLLSPGKRGSPSSSSAKTHLRKRKVISKSKKKWGNRVEIQGEERVVRRGRRGGRRGGEEAF